MDLRPEDFRRLWPEAVAVMMEDVERITQRLSEVQQSNDARTAELKEMALAVPEWVRQAKTMLREVADTQISRIEHSHEEMLQTQRAFLAQFEAERRFFEGQRQDLANRLADVYRAQRELEDARTSFNSMSLWKRIFKKV